MSDFSKTAGIVKKVEGRMNLSLRVYSPSWYQEKLGIILYPVKGEKDRYLGVWSENKTFHFADPLFQSQKKKVSGFFLFILFTLRII